MSMLASIPSPADNMLEIGPLDIHYYGVLMAIAVLVGVVITLRRYERMGGDPVILERVLLWVIVLGFLGARLAFVSTRLSRYTDRPWGILFLWEGGIAMFGGIAVGAITAYVMLRRAHQDFWRFGDAIALGMPVAQAIARFGNYINQELFGTPTTLPWGLEIDAAHRPTQFASAETFHPTFLYEALWNLLIIVPVILWLERTRRLRRGAILGVYLTLYATIRFLNEFLRTDTDFRFLGLSKNGWVSLTTIFVGIGIVWWRSRVGEEESEVAESSG
jgi:prolipoprotein diacylglyceryl transferase